jgi:hypothetical protein
MKDPVLIALIGAIASVVCATVTGLIAWITKNRVDGVKHELNHRLTQWRTETRRAMKVAVAAAHAKGVKSVRTRR